MIGNINKTKEILNKYNLRAKKSFGQNFLIDENILKKIIKVSDITKDDGVIEIGPGIGALTEHLCINAKRVVAYDIDGDMIKILNNELSNYNNLTIIHKDFLEVNIEEELKKFEDCNRVIVISNLPYYITTPLLFKLLNANTRIEEMYLMMQKEVGARLSSKPRSKDYNALSVLMQYKTISKIEFDVSRNCFLPVPNVESVVISVKRIKNDYTPSNEPKFLSFIQNIFIQKRKTLLNNILSSYNFEKENIKEIIRKLGHSESVRSEELNLKQIIDLYEEIFNSPR